MSTASTQHKMSSLQELNKDLLCIVMSFLPLIEKLQILNILVKNKELFITFITKSMEPELRSIKDATIFADHECYQLFYTARSLLSSDISEGSEKIKWRLYSFNIKKIAYIIAMHGNLEMLKLWYKINSDSILNSNFLYRGAIAGGNLHILDWLYENNHTWDKCVFSSYCNDNTMFIPVLKWLIGHEYPLSEQVFIESIKTNYLDNVLWVSMEDCPFTELIFYAAADVGNINIFRYLYYCFHKHLFFNDPLICIQITDKLSLNGHLNILQWWYKLYPISFTKSSYQSAIEGGHLHILEWMTILKIPEIGEGFSDYYRAISSLSDNINKIDVLNWLYVNGHELFDGCLYSIAAAYNNDINILQWLLDNECPLDIDDLLDLTETAANIGNIDILKWMLKNNLYLDMHECAINATIGEDGCLNVLAWLLTDMRDYWGQELYLTEIRETNNWGVDLCYSAARLGLLNVLQWLIENGCPCNINMCIIYAIKNDYLVILKWATTHIDFSWNSDFCSQAAEIGYLGILQWLIENKCPYDIDTCVELAKESGHFHILRWLTKNYFFCESLRF
jgi:hypothetical protein